MQRTLVSFLAVPLLIVPATAQKHTPTSAHGATCRSVTFEGEVDAGQGFRKQFTPGLEFFLEPLASGWIVRVLEMHGGREVRRPLDYADVATPPYRSPNPLLLSTDWAFRAQDAVAWNPRNFRYAADAESFRRLGAEHDRLLAGDHSGESALASLVVQQPEASLRILDAKIVPGAQNEAAMALAVATEHIPVSVETLSGGSGVPLGRLAHVHFRVRIELPKALSAAPGMTISQESCTLRPTG